MKHSLRGALCVTVLAAAAFADTRLADIRTHADQVQKRSEQLAALLNVKQPDTQAIREGIISMGQNIENLQRLVVEVTEANPQFVSRGDKDWDLLKQKVQLLSIFHSSKDELMKADDLKKNRSLLRAHAKGLAVRAERLQETVQRLQGQL